ncbi:unnamed protein product [Mesocestoides corti]|uniref:Uncharacterized protein n=1 Tax=Mesocestoides corti TaxID=53468 RepID=A0A0R3U8T1_MESCO|nr:unnamed protein product [Mesocestoides corti]
MTRNETGEVVEKTVHELHTTLERLECEISAFETIVDAVFRRSSGSSGAIREWLRWLVRRLVAKTAFCSQQQAPLVSQPCNLANTVATSAPSQSTNGALGVVEGGDEKAKETCVCSVAVSRKGSVQSLERLKELRSVMKSLLRHFDSIRTIQDFVIERNDPHNTLLLLCCVPSEKLSTEVRWSVFQVKLNVARCRPGRLFVTAGTQHTMARLVVVSAARSAVVYEGGAQSGLPNGIATEAKAFVISQHAESLLLSTCSYTTMDNLQLNAGGDTEAPSGDVGDSLEVSFVRTGCQSFIGGCLNVSRVEDHNRRVFDRASVAVARIQDAVYEWLVKAAAEVLMALSGPDDVDCVVSEDDRRDYSRRRETHVSFSKVRGEHSEWADQTEAGEVEKVIRKK